MIISIDKDYYKNLFSLPEILNKKKFPCPFCYGTGNADFFAKELNLDKCPGCQGQGWYGVTYTSAKISYVIRNVIRKIMFILTERRNKCLKENLTSIQKEMKIGGP